MHRIFRVLVMLLLFIPTSIFAQNIIVNGNFEGYNTYGQISAPSDTDYEPVNGAYGVDYGHYCIDITSGNGHGINNGWNIISGNGKFMIVNGWGDDVNATKVVWKQTVDVTTSTTYNFSCRVVLLTKKPALWNPASADLRLIINGNQIAQKTVSLVNNQSQWVTWDNVTWTSGNSVSQATIEIYDYYSGNHGAGDDFGLDDISFVPNVVYSVDAQDDFPNTTLCLDESVDVNVLQNDNVLPNTNDAQVQVLTNPVPHGTAQVLSNKKIRYTFTDPNYYGEVQFDYRVTIHGLQSEATVHINTAQPPTLSNINLPSTIDICEGDELTLPNPTVAWNGSQGTSGWQVKVNGNWQVVNGNTIPSITTGHTKIRYTATNQCGTETFEATLNVHQEEEVTLPAVQDCDSYTWYGTTYTQSGTYDYETTTQYGCTRIEHLPLTIYYSDTVDSDVSACEQYTWHGQTYTSSGTYTYPTTNENGCFRLERLHLTISDRFRQVVNLTECDSYYWPRSQQWYYQSTLDSVTAEGPQGGCDSTFVLDLTIHYSETLDPVVIEACDSYYWNGQVYTESGLYTYETTNEFGCELTHQLQLTIHESESIMLPPITECDSFEWHGHIYTGSGLVVFDTVNQFGCNVQYQLPLTINYSDTLDWDPVTECDSYFWYGQNITETGLYTHMSTTPEGCDLLERINVTINHSVIDTLSPASGCDSYFWHGQTYTQSGYYTYETTGPTGCPYTEVCLITINHSSPPNDIYKTSCEPYQWFDSIYSEPGIYYHEMTNSQGCDSLLILHLDFADIFTSYDTLTRCESYEWYGSVYTESGDYEHEETNPNGCDTVCYLHLTIAPNYVVDDYQEDCYSYTWIDTVMNQSGIYERHFQSNDYCDSLVVLHLTIKEAVHHEFEQQTCLPFTWNGVEYYYEGYYEQFFDAANGCDSIVTMHLVQSDAMISEFDRISCTPITWENQICDHDGDYYHTYQSQQGCDSIVTMHFSLADEIVNEFDTIACEPFTWFEYECNQDGMTCFHSFVTSMGCDSTVIKHVYMNHFEMSTQFISACDWYEYNGIVYDEPGVTYIEVDTIFNQYGCDSIVSRIHLEIKDSEMIGLIDGLSNVYVASNLINGIYRYEINPDEVQGEITWSLSNPDWLIVEEQDNYCRVFVGTPGSATLTANFRTPDCGEIEREFIINAGFFGVGEQTMEVNVYPNPTKGTVTIEAEGIESVRLINMMGQVLEDRHGIHTNSLDWNLSGYAPSVYLIEIHTVYGTVKKRVTVCR